MKRKGRRFVVTMDIPENVSLEEACAYIEEAVAGWCGSLRPAGGYGPHDEGDPLFYLNRDSISVRTLSSYKSIE